MIPRATDIRYRVEPGDVPPDKAARRLHLTLERFTELLPKLLARGFPAADPDTGMFDLDAIDLWRRDRHRARLALTTGPAGPQPVTTIQPGMADRFIVTKERQAQRGRRHRGIA